MDELSLVKPNEIECVACLRAVRLDEWVIPMVKIMSTYHSGSTLISTKEEHGYAHAWHFQNTEWDDDDE